VRVNISLADRREEDAAAAVVVKPAWKAFQGGGQVPSPYRALGKRESTNVARFKNNLRVDIAQRPAVLLPDPGAARARAGARRQLPQRGGRGSDERGGRRAQQRHGGRRGGRGGGRRGGRCGGAVAAGAGREQAGHQRAGARECAPGRAPAAARVATLWGAAPRGLTHADGSRDQVRLPGGGRGVASLNTSASVGTSAPSLLFVLRAPCLWLVDECLIIFHASTSTDALMVGRGPSSMDCGVGARGKRRVVCHQRRFPSETVGRRLRHIGGCWAVQCQRLTSHALRNFLVWVLGIKL
jgi:hypothetical protein